MKRNRSNRSPRWVRALLRWFQRNQRSMPWRDQPEPYRIWISEIMLQQTRVQTVIPYFHRFLQRFPDVGSLARSDLSTILKLWEGLGYYSRARNLKRAAQLIVQRHHGHVPGALAELRDLPGIGAYTAAAIASIGYGVAVPVVDGNVLRVAARFWGLSGDIRSAAGVRTITARLTSAIQGVPPGAFNQALMELGALLCRPRTPDCAACPLRVDCIAFRENRTAELPCRKAAPATPHYAIAVGVIWKRNRILIARRREDQMLGGLWEFPGGKQKSRESLPRTAAREIREETGLRVRVGPVYTTVRHAYSHFSITLTAFRCEWLAGRARPQAAAELRWIRPDRLPDYPFPRANRRIADILLAAANPTAAP